MADNKFLDEYKEYKNIDTDDDKDDKILNKVLDGAENYLKTQYKLYLEKETLTLKYNGKNTNFIVLPNKYVSLSKVKINGVEIDTDNFYLNDNILYYINNVFISGIQNVEVEFDIGFENTDDIPQDLKLAFFILSDKFYENVKQNANSMDYIADANFGRVQLVNNLPKTFYTLLQPHLSYYIGY